MKEELLEKIKQTRDMLYQNREHEAMESAADLLSRLQEMITLLNEEQLAESGEFVIAMMREFLETYQNQDMLGMADCLTEKVELFVCFYFQATE